MTEDRIECTIQSHPDYADYLNIWEMIDDCLDGATSIKKNGERYLPKTEGMAADKVYGDIIYKRYLHNAQFPDYAQDYFLASSGLLKQADPVLNFPDAMRDHFVPSPSYVANKSLYDVYGEILDGVMKYNRAGVLLDPPNTSEKILHEYPLLITYDTYSIVNWGYDVYKGKKIVTWVLLNESYWETSNEHFGRKQVNNYRFLGLKTKTDNGKYELDEPMYYTYKGGEDIIGIFNPPVPYRDEGQFIVEVGEYTITYPNIHGKTLDHIPFYCFTGTKMTLTPERPICQSLCEACIYLYGLSADYREYLYKQGFGILFGKGFETNDPIYTGVNKAIVVNTPDADLKMVESSGNGLAEYRLALNEASLYAKSLGLAILKGNGDETGVSVAKRQGFKTASLKSISKTVAGGFEQIAKTAAEWAGLSREEIDSITIIPNIDFSASATTSDLTAYQNEANADYMIVSDYDRYLNLKAKGMTCYATFDEYMKELTDAQKKRDAYLLDKEIMKTKALNKIQLEQQLETAKMQEKINAVSSNVDISTDESANSENTGKGDIKHAKGADEGDMSKGVRCKESGKVYSSASEASKDVGVSVAAITRAVRGLTKTAGKQNGVALHWEYA